MKSQLAVKVEYLSTEMTLRQITKMLRLEMLLKILTVQEPLRAVAAVDLVGDRLPQLGVDFMSFAVSVSLRCLFAEELLFASMTVKLQSAIGMNQKAVCFH